MKRLSRRTFLQMASTLGVAGIQSVAAQYAVAPAQAQPQAPRVVRIAHLSRRQGDDSAMANYAIMGAQLGVEEANVTAGMFGTRVELIIEDATTPDNMLSLARKLTAQENLSAIIAALDDSTTARLSAFGQQEGVVYLNTSARGGDLRGEKCQRLTFHVEPDLALRGEELRHFLEQYKATGLKTLLAGVPLDMIGLWQASPESLQGIWVTSWYHGLERFSARELNRRFSRRFEKPAESFAWANWAAVKLVVEGMLRSGKTEASALVNYLEGAPPFDGHKGKALTFRDWNHQLRQPLYVLKAREDKPEDARDLLQLIGEVPPPAAPGKPVVEVLDTPWGTEN